MPIYFDLMDHSLPLAPESIGNHWEQEDINRPNGYPFYHWLQTEQGQGVIQIQDRELPLPEQAGILISPFTPHRYFRGTGQWVTSFVTFAGKLALEIHRIVGSAPYLFVDPPGGAPHGQWIRQTIQAHERKTLSGLQLSCECYGFLLRLGHSHAQTDGMEHPLYRQYVLPTLGDIEARYGEQITAHSLAAARYVSPQYLSRLFKRFAGCSVYAYLTQYRINQAKSLLVNRPAVEVQEIGYLVGYTDTSHFIAMFKGRTGYTPLEFRKLHIG